MDAIIAGDEVIRVGDRVKVKSTVLPRLATDIRNELEDVPLEVKTVGPLNISVCSPINPHIGAVMAATLFTKVG